MNHPEQFSVRPPSRRWWGLFVFVVLVGVLGMHALAPGAALLGGHPHASPMSDAVSVSATLDDCGGEGHCGSGHVTHADATCSAPALSGGPVLPALVADPVAGVVRDDVPRACALADPDGARAPPSLAKLQLLRI